MQQSRFQMFVEYLLDNIFDIATIVVAGYLVIRHQVQPFTPNDIAELATWILAVLGLIAVSGLWDRNRRLHRIEKLSEESRDLVLRSLGRKLRASDFFVSQYQLTDEVLTSANSIFLSGITLTRFTREYMYALGQRLVAGAYIRIIIADPTVASLLQEFVFRGGVTAEYWCRQCEAAEAVANAIANTPDCKGKLEIGYLPHMPSFSIVMIDPEEPHGYCFVKLYHHKWGEPNPAFELRASDDPSWFGFFRRQSEVLWNGCRVERLPKTAEPTIEK